MVTRTIELPLDIARKLFKQNDELKEIALQAYSEAELKDCQLRNWTDYYNYVQENGIAVDTYYIGTDGNIKLCNNPNVSKDALRCLCLTKKEAEAFLALMQLRQLRKLWIDNRELDDWSDNKYNCCIYFTEEGNPDVSNFYIERCLSFPDKQMAINFLDCFKDLIVKAKPLL